MKMWMKITAWSIGSLIVILFLFAQWYKQTYSMQVAQSFEVNDITSPQHILIATQGSVFKDSVVQLIITELRKNNVYIKVVDISNLPIIEEKQWAAIVVLHTWEFSKPPAYAKDFINRTTDHSKMIVFSTSGDGNFKIEGIDAISSASRLTDAGPISVKILSRLNRILKIN